MPPVLDALTNGRPLTAAVAGVRADSGHRFLCLVGTILTQFGGAEYNTPIRAWIPLNYPESPPAAYVVCADGAWRALY
jgi:hypothetical protein